MDFGLQVLGEGKRTLICERLPVIGQFRCEADESEVGVNKRTSVHCSWVF